MDVHKNAPLTPKGREAMVRSVLEDGLSKARPGVSSTSHRRLLPNGSIGSAQKAWMGCGIVPPGLFHCQAKQRLPHGRWSRHCAVSATPASKSQLKPVFPRPPSAASCGGWD